jgi:hypothetical protein
MKLRQGRSTYSLSRLRGWIFEGLLLRQHALVEDAGNEDAFLVLAVKDHVPVFFKAMQAGANPLTRAA